MICRSLHSHVAVQWAIRGRYSCCIHLWWCTCVCITRFPSTCAKHMAHSSRGSYPSQQPRQADASLQRLKERCIYIYIYTYTHIFIYTHTHTHIHLCTLVVFKVCIHKQVHACVYVYTYMPTFVSMHIYICVCVCIYVHIHIYTYTHTYIHTYIHIYIYIHKATHSVCVHA